MAANHFFISYSRQDAETFALKLADELEAGPEGYRVWMDQRGVRLSRQDWDDQLVEAIQTCEAVLFVMSTDSVRRGSVCKDEWVWALKYQKPVIPIRAHPEAELPFRLSSRQCVDFATDVERGLAQLRRDLRWMGTAEGQLRELEVRLAEAERELPRVDSSQQPRVEQEIERLRARIDAQQRLVADPAAVARQTEARIEAGMQRERQPERPEVAPPRAKFINRPPLTAPDYFQDRHSETGLIGQFLQADGLRMMSVVGRGGVGKTAMVCRLLMALEAGRLPDDLGELPVDGIVYLSPLGAHPVDFAHLYPDLCRLLPEEVAAPMLQRFHDPHETPAELMRSLLERFPTGRWVVLLDNLEDVVDAAGVGLTDSALEEALCTVLTAPQHGVKVVVTTRVAARNLLLTQPGVQRRLDLDEGLPSPFAEEVLRAMDPYGSLGIKGAPAALLAQARERTRGFPRALEALVAILGADRDTTLPEVLASTQSMPENVVEALVGEAFNLLDALSQHVMQALAVYPGPVPPVAIDYLLQPFRPAIDSASVLGRLVNMQFVRRDAGRYYLHQVDREYALRRIPVGEPSDRESEPPRFSQYALHERAADYYLLIRTPRETWRTLDDLTPQLAEFQLRCQTTDFVTATEVLLEISNSYLQVWGHARLARDLHERVRGELTDDWVDARNLTELANCSMLLGELRRAVELFDQALAIFRRLGSRSGESSALRGLGMAHGTLGEVRREIEFHEQALAIDRDLGSLGGEGADLNNLGFAYALLGQTRRAVEFHEQALTIQREIGDRLGEGAALTGLGLAAAALGDLQGAISFHEQALVIDRELGSRGSEAADLANLGNAYADLGETQRAIEHYEQALAIFREIGDRGYEGRVVHNLGNNYADLGDVRRAMDFYGQALAIFRDIGDRGQEASALSNMGNRYTDLADVQRAMELYEEARAIFRETGDRANEAAVLENLGLSSATLGEVRRAIELEEQALAICREIGARRFEAMALIYLALVYTDACDWPQAVRHGEEGVRIADEVGLAHGSSEGRLRLAIAHLHAGDIALARETAEAGLGYDYPLTRDNIALVLGIALLREGRVDAARDAFRDSLGAAEGLLASTPDAYDELDSRALALCGLAVTDNPDHVTEATEAFRTAREVARAPAVVGRVLRLFDALAASDGTGILAPVRPAAAGELRRPQSI